MVQTDSDTPERSELIRRTEMEIKRSGSQASGKGPAEWFTGTVRIDVCITCMTATEFFVRNEDVPPGMFIAAVGADDTRKQEIDPVLMASAKVVADSLDQSCTIGDTHHAIAGALMRKENVYAELSEIVAGKKPGRTSDNKIIIFQSTC